MHYNAEAVAKKNIQKMMAIFAKRAVDDSY